MASPYAAHPQAEWRSITEGLIDEHPLHADEIVDVVLTCWADVLTTKIAGRLLVGIDVPVAPTMMGNFIHALIPAELSSRHPGVWRGELSKGEKDIVYEPDDRFSIELKTSSHPTAIFGNRSYAQPAAPGTKSKDGYYIGVNFQKFMPSVQPNVVRISFGWLDHSDWVPQASQTGQQASLTPAARASKLLVLYP